MLQLMAKYAKTQSLLFFIKGQKATPKPNPPPTHLPRRSDPTYSALEEDIAVVTLYFGSPTAYGGFRTWAFSCSFCEWFCGIKILVPSASSLLLHPTEYQISERITIIDFVASLGGVFGLCIGASLVSFVEIFYWTIVGFCTSIRSWSGHQYIRSSGHQDLRTSGYQDIKISGHCLLPVICLLIVNLKYKYQSEF